MVRHGKILLYMDDILIAIDTVTENLEILREVLITLKKYKLEFGEVFIFKKRDWIFRLFSISYGITISKRHIQAISEYIVTMHSPRITSA